MPRRHVVFSFTCFLILLTSVVLNSRVACAQTSAEPSSTTKTATAALPTNTADTPLVAPSTSSDTVKSEPSETGTTKDVKSTPAPQPPLPPAHCERVIDAEVVALPQPIMHTRHLAAGAKRL